MVKISGKNEELRKILESNEFRGSSNYKNLLRYLAECAFAERTPTESEIAERGLGKEHLDTSSDASVRVYIHNLRKKLASYYINEGKNDSIKIAIPKGQHYKLTFSRQNDDKTIFSKSILAAIISLPVIAVLIVLLITNSSGKVENEIDSDNFVWKEFFDNEKPVLIVLGDYYLMRDEAGRYIRDYKVNSDSDYDSLIISDRTELNKSGHTFLGKFAVWCFNEIVRQMVAKGTKYEMKLSSNLIWEDLAKYNIIFIGSFKTLGLMKKFTVGLNSSYRINPNTIYFSEGTGTSPHQYHAPKNPDTGYLRDYALVAKLPGPSSNTILMFSSTHDIGHISTVKYFNDSKFLENLSENFSEENSGHYFEAIFEVQGFERTGFYPNMVEFREVSKTYRITSP